MTLTDAFLVSVATGFYFAGMVAFWRQGRLFALFWPLSVPWAMIVSQSDRGDRDDG